MTDTEAKKFYDSKAWQAKRIEILKRDRFECQDCRARIQKAVAEGKWLPEKEKKIARAEQVHHIQELKEHPELVEQLLKRFGNYEAELKDVRKGFAGESYDTAGEAVRKQIESVNQKVDKIETISTKEIDAI